MYLTSLVLQHFRSYSQKKIDFNNALTVIVGQNTAGKTNLVEAILMLASGKSFRAEKDSQMIAFGEDVGRIQGLVERNEEKTKLEVTIAQGEITGGRLLKRFFVNEVPKSRNRFIGFLPTVLFRPEELDIIIDGPGIRRDFLDEVLEQVDMDYRNAKLIYDKALRQRNALLDVVRETGARNTQQFEYWDELLITNGTIITLTREYFLEFINTSIKDVFECKVIYDKSIISEDRLLQYKDAEMGSATTLVGPHRDDFFITARDKEGNDQNIKHFGSRGQQRLVVLQLKLLQMAFIEKKLFTKPLLVLDDIFSELDSHHISLVLEKIVGRQVIMTTTHKEFLPDFVRESAAVVELSK